MKLRYLSAAFACSLALGCGISKAPGFELIGLDGKTTYTNDTLKGKVVLLDVWRTWCGPCRQIQPAIHQFADQYRDRGLVVLGVTDESPSLVSSFVDRAPLGYPAVQDWGDRSEQAFDVIGFPTLIIIDRDGTVAYNKSPDTMKEITAVLDRLMPDKR